MASGDKAAALLARFPGPVTLYPSRRKMTFLLLTGLLFVAASLWILLKGDPADTFMGWLSLIFFGACMLVGIVVMMPGASSLKLDQDGFLLTNLFRRHRYSWREVSDFTYMRIAPSTQQMVVFNHTGASSRFLAKISMSLAGRHGGLPDTYGLRAEDLANLMSAWKRRADAEQ